MKYPRLCRIVRASLLAAVVFSLPTIAPAQGGKKTASESPMADADSDHEEQRAEWFSHGRTVPGKSAAELRYRAYQAKMLARTARAGRGRAARGNSVSPLQTSTGGWTPLGPVPLASDATGDGFQNYNQVSGRATAVAIDPADPSGNTVYIGGAQGGVWKSANAAASVANDVIWTPLTDDQATLSIGAIAIQPGNSNPASSVIVVGTGEADNSGDSYFGLGILVSTNAGGAWTLIPTAAMNGGTAPFSGLGATRIAFSMANANTVVAAMAAANEGVTDGALTSNTYRGLYTSTDGGQSWTYDALFAGASEATSATSVVYNAAAGLFFAALRYHGFYSSPDGLNWTLLPNQPGASGLLSTANCPQNYATTCPIYRGEITVVPGRNEMYVWFVSADVNGNPVDQGIWQSLNAGASWTQISDSGIINCGDPNGGCGVEQGFYNLELLAVPDCPNGVLTCSGNPTDLYAGAINLYKCEINSVTNPNCATTPFMNLTHVYGCDPLGAPAHVHPDEHALAFSILNAGSSSNTDLMYFANDGGIYRALNGFTGLLSGSCSGTNLFDDLNQNLGSMTQFVSFSQDPTEKGTLLGGTQDNGSPATNAATSSTSWGNVLSGDGGYNAIDPNTGNWFASYPDTGGGTLGIQECASGVNCNDSLFNEVVSSNDIGGDDGAFYFPYILDPQSTTAMLVGTCRVWSGPRLGGAFTLLSPNFDTLGTATCTGDEVNVVRALAAGGPFNANGSEVIYATTDGPGPNELSTPVGGNVWVTTNATAVSGAASTFANTTMNGPAGSSINPNQFPISGVAIDTSDSTANTAYVAVMGFTGGPGHVWQTTNAGASWTDWTGFGGTAPLPDSPTNAVVVDPQAHIVYVGTDVGVFESPTSTPSWTEVGPIPSPTASGFLPDVAVTALAIFNFGGEKLLRASTYGRGVWQLNLLATPDFQVAVSNTPLTVFQGSTAIFNGTLTALNGYDNSIELSCMPGPTSPPIPCTPNFASYTPTQAGAPFTISVGTGAVGNYDFNAQATGSDPNNTTHSIPVSLQIVNLMLSTPSPSTVTEPRGATSPPVSFSVTAQGTFNESVTLGCAITPSIAGATCAFTPGAVIDVASGSPVNMMATVTVPATTPTGNYAVTLQATASAGVAPLTASFNIAVVLNPSFVLSEPAPFPTVNAGSTNSSGAISIASQDGFSGTVSLTCSLAARSGGCSVTPTSVSAFPASANVIVHATGLAAGANQLTVQATSAATTQALVISFNVADYSITGPQAFSTAPGGQVAAKLNFTSTLYSGQVNATCDASALPGTQCTLTPPSVMLTSGGSASMMASINIPNNATPGAYSININTLDSGSGEPSHTWTIALTIGQDYTLGDFSPTSQPVNAGQSATYNFAVIPVGTAFSGQIELSCSATPAFTGSCSFSPSSAGPLINSTAESIVMTVSTESATGQIKRISASGISRMSMLWVLVPGIALLVPGGTKRRSRLRLLRLGLILLFFLPSCGGGGINGGSTNASGNAIPTTYSITVIGTSGNLINTSVPVTLVVSP